jgi:hypothetical protein
LGLGKIFIYSVFSGLSFAFSYRISEDAPDAGFAFDILNQISQNTNEQIQAGILILSIVLAILSIYSLSKFFRQIYEQRLIGIITVIVGFSGSFLILSGSQQETFLVAVGAALWIAGIALIIIAKRS